MLSTFVVVIRGNIVLGKGDAVPSQYHAAVMLWHYNAMSMCAVMLCDCEFALCDNVLMLYLCDVMMQ